MYNFPPPIEHITVGNLEGVDLLERFELFRRMWCTSIPYPNTPAEVDIPPVSTCNLDRLVAYLESAQKAINAKGLATFPGFEGACETYGLIGPNSWGHGHGTGIPWAGMAVLDINDDDTFVVTIAWNPERGSSTQEREMQRAKEFFERASK